MITQPQPLPAHLIERRQRRALLDIMPGYKKKVEGVSVKRVADWDKQRYILNGVELELSAVLAVIAGKMPAPVPTKPIQLELDLGDDE